MIQQEKRTVLEYFGMRDVHEHEMMEHKSPHDRVRCTVCVHCHCTQQQWQLTLGTLHNAVLSGLESLAECGSQASEYYTLRLTSACN